MWDLWEKQITVCKINVWGCAEILPKTGTTISVKDKKSRGEINSGCTARAGRNSQRTRGETHRVACKSGLSLTLELEKPFKTHARVCVGMPRHK